MKKLFLTFGLITMSGAAFAQGTVNWSAIPFPFMTADTNATEISPLFGGGGASGVGANGGVLGVGNFYFELLYAPYTGVQAPVPNSLGALLSWSDTGLEAQSTASAGRLAPINGNAGAIVPWSLGTTNSIMMVGWSANLGSTWSAVEAILATGNYWVPNAYFGESATGYITPLASSISPGAAVFGAAPTPQGLPIFSLNTQLYPPVPEPSTLVLAGLGSLSLWLLRRRE